MEQKKEQHMTIIFQTDHTKTVITILEGLFHIQPSMIGVTNLRYDVQDKTLQFPLLDWLGSAFKLTLISRPEIIMK